MTLWRDDAFFVLIVVRNLLISREPIYGIGEWAARYAPDFFGLTVEDLRRLGDGRLGRGLDRLFECNEAALVMDVVRWGTKEFDLSLEEFHNDGTSVSVFGAYARADEEGRKQGRKTVAITYGHSRARRPELKQLLYNLTITEDGGVPVYFSTPRGNTVADKTHCETWKILRQLVGWPDFLYVADDKLATTLFSDFLCPVRF